jgi:hypothetical protein
VSSVEWSEKMSKFYLHSYIRTDWWQYFENYWWNFSFDVLFSYPSTSHPHYPSSWCSSSCYLHIFLSSFRSKLHHSTQRTQWPNSWNIRSVGTALGFKNGASAAVLGMTAPGFERDRKLCNLWVIY